LKKIFSFLFLATFFTCTSDSEQTYFGCTNEIAVNYDPVANADDGSCLFAEGCMDEDACNFNELALEDDGSCKYAEALSYVSSQNNNIETIIENKCNYCHYHQDKSILTYQYLSIIGSTLLVDFINGQASIDFYDYSIMPPPHVTPLTDCEKEELLIWVDNNFPYDETGR